jgi:hypothetical protein
MSWHALLDSNLWKANGLTPHLYRLAEIQMSQPFALEAGNSPAIFGTTANWHTRGGTAYAFPPPNIGQRRYALTVASNRDAAENAPQPMCRGDATRTDRGRGRRQRGKFFG